MATIIKIKNSGTVGSPTAVATGEMAYSYLSGSQSNGGDRIYIGTGTETAGEAANIEVIGGKYFTDMMDHVHGVKTASSAVILDASGKIDSWDVDNINIDGNTISASNSNGDITVSPLGTGGVIMDTNTYLMVPTGTVGTRPTASAALNSAIRYNDTANRFEGVVSGSWTGLGGVVDVDQDTYITAEEGSDDDTLRFYAGGTQEALIDAAGLTIGNVNIDGNTISTIASDSSNTLYLDPNPSGVTGTVVIAGNLQINGTTTSVNSSTITVEDPIFTLGGANAPAADDNKDRGIEFNWYDTAATAAKVGFFGFDDSTGKFTFISDATNTSEVFSGTPGAAVFGDLEASTATLGSPLAVTSGGTGVSSYTSNGIFASNTAGDALTFLASSTHGHVMQINSTGVPVFGHLDGGTY